MSRSARGTGLTILAVLFALLAISNLSKPLHLNSEQGFVLFGARLDGTANAVAGPLFGVFLLVYAAGVWGMRRWALPMGVAYALYVSVNLVLFRLRTPPPPDLTGHPLFALLYVLVALGCSWGAVRLLRRRRAALR
ncbi:MAG: hypothetical protein KIT14_07255 [bacterium]|nr:hypothetical protein [bacterium]